MEYHYMTVISGGPFTIVRVPLIPPKSKRGKWKHVAKWTEIRSAVGAVMREYGIKPKDIYAIENYSHPNDWDENDLWIRHSTREKNMVVEDRARRAYAGDSSILPEFRLYDWVDGALLSRVSRLSERLQMKSTQAEKATRGDVCGRCGQRRVHHSPVMSSCSGFIEPTIQSKRPELVCGMEVGTWHEHTIECYR